MQLHAQHRNSNVASHVHTHRVRAQQASLANESKRHRQTGEEELQAQHFTRTSAGSGISTLVSLRQGNSGRGDEAPPGANFSATTTSPTTGAAKSSCTQTSGAGFGKVTLNHCADLASNKQGATENTGGFMTAWREPDTTAADWKLHAVKSAGARMIGAGDHRENMLSRAMDASMPYISDSSIVENSPSDGGTPATISHSKCKPMSCKHTTFSNLVRLNVVMDTDAPPQAHVQPLARKHEGHMSRWGLQA
jgi:hypothetical protein